jgi:hypothetical protein
MECRTGATGQIGHIIKYLFFIYAVINKFLFIYIRPGLD